MTRAEGAMRASVIMILVLGFMAGSCLSPAGPGFKDAVCRKLTVCLDHFSGMRSLPRTPSLKLDLIRGQVTTRGRSGTNRKDRGPDPQSPEEGPGGSPPFPSRNPAFEIPPPLTLHPSEIVDPGERGQPRHKYRYHNFSSRVDLWISNPKVGCSNPSGGALFLP